MRVKTRAWMTDEGLPGEQGTLQQGLNEDLSVKGEGSTVGNMVIQ